MFPSAVRISAVSMFTLESSNSDLCMALFLWSGFNRTNLYENKGKLKRRERTVYEGASFCITGSTYGDEWLGESGLRFRNQSYDCDHGQWGHEN
ncbi:hypothetical protein EUGRSUZ_F04465 [Eucalyptus grandis]|uniref:Uncharacterized protein n=2 Tax=Eucalyptus grandis TaxID=71139 RepID=A0ACC3KQJ4_EUCGR|nr:hypothetical protein EUGRSUZ_F04465 [Eucalyptus grandis]